VARRWFGGCQTMAQWWPGGGSAVFEQWPNGGVSVEEREVPPRKRFTVLKKEKYFTGN
jgi:hypothetical protein